jgi:hypothetical protein
MECEFSRQDSSIGSVSKQLPHRNHSPHHRPPHAHHDTTARACRGVVGHTSWRHPHPCSTDHMTQSDHRRTLIIFIIIMQTPAPAASPRPAGWARSSLQPAVLVQCIPSLQLLQTEQSMQAAKSQRLPPLQYHPTPSTGTHSTLLRTLRTLGHEFFDCWHAGLCVSTPSSTTVHRCSCTMLGGPGRVQLLPGSMQQGPAMYVPSAARIAGCHSQPARSPPKRAAAYTHTRAHQRQHSARCRCYELLRTRHHARNTKFHRSRPAHPPAAQTHHPCTSSPSCTARALHTNPRPMDAVAQQRVDFGDLKCGGIRAAICWIL